MGPRVTHQGGGHGGGGGRDWSTQGALDLERPVTSYLPGFTGDGRELVTVRMLLDHTSGLPSFVPLYRRAATPAAAWDSLLVVPLLTTPGFLTRYSDLNAMLLGRVLEQVTGEPLDRLSAAWSSSRWE